MKLFESIKRLFEPRSRPPAETLGAPADRPPPPEPTLRQPEPPPPRSEPAPPDLIPAAEVPVEDEAEKPVADEAEEIVEETPDVSEIRALLEAVAEEPEPAESVAETIAEPPAPALAPEPTPTLFEESTKAVVEVPSAAPQQVGDALVLTLATPPVTFTVAKSAATIGRGQENSIRLDDLSVSRRHARIAYKQGGYWLSDTGSMGGTWVDGTRLNAPYRIGAGQIIDIGLCRLTASFTAGASNVNSADKKDTPRKARSEIAGQVRRRR